MFLVAVFIGITERVLGMFRERLNVNVDRSILHQSAEQTRPFYGGAMH